MKDYKEICRSNVTGFSHIGLSVKDIEKSIDFYTNVLGFECYYRVVNHGIPLAFLRLGPLVLELIRFPEDGSDLGVPSYQERKFDGPVDHICLYGTNLEDLLEALVRLGIPVTTEKPLEHPDVFDGTSCIFFRGPDNESIEIML